jgi:hypothetical protein
MLGVAPVVRLNQVQGFHLNLTALLFNFNSMGTFLAFVDVFSFMALLFLPIPYDVDKRTF